MECGLQDLDLNMSRHSFSDFNKGEMMEGMEMPSDWIKRYSHSVL
jgi:hypothetical protein